MASNAVPGFLPSRHGLGFANRWPSTPIPLVLGPLRIPGGNADRGLCGGMIFVARDHFERDEPVPVLSAPPSASEALFREIVDRQSASFGTFLIVPIRFWLAAAGSQATRDRVTALDAWPAIKREIDLGRPAMVGLVRLATRNPFDRGLGHQVVGYRYEESPSRVSIWVYDPNEPGNDDVELSFECGPDGSLVYAYRPSAPLIGLLALPYAPPRR